MEKKMLLFSVQSTKNKKEQKARIEAYFENRIVYLSYNY